MLRGAERNLIFLDNWWFCFFSVRLILKQLPPACWYIYENCEAVWHFPRQLKMRNTLVVDAVDQPIWSAAYVIGHSSETLGVVSPKVDFVVCCTVLADLLWIQPKAASPPLQRIHQLIILSSFLLHTDECLIWGYWRIRLYFLMKPPLTGMVLKCRLQRRWPLKKDTAHIHTHVHFLISDFFDSIG